MGETEMASESALRESTSGRYKIVSVSEGYSARDVFDLFGIPMDAFDELTAKFLSENQIAIDGDKFVIAGKRAKIDAGRVFRYDTSWTRTKEAEVVATTTAPEPVEPVENVALSEVVPEVKETVVRIVTSCSRCNSVSREVRNAVAYMFLGAATAITGMAIAYYVTEDGRPPHTIKGQKNYR